MKNVISVNSLSEYFNAIETNQLFNCISRGENKKYEYPLSSSLFRHDLEKYKSNLEEFYFETESTISEIQKENFIAFAQHHGIPTNLLDFSFSPLISLFFAINNSEEKGLVYFINKNKLSSISQNIKTRPIGWGALEDLLNYDNELLAEAMPSLVNAFNSNRLSVIEYFENHLEEFINQFREKRNKEYLATLKGGVDDLEFALNKYRQDKPKWEDDKSINEPITLQIYDSIPNFLKGMEKVYRNDIFYPKEFIKNFKSGSKSNKINISGSANIEVLLFLLKLEEIEKMQFIRKPTTYTIDFPFYFSYRPSLIDNRVINQSSIFVVQPFKTNFYYIGKKNAINEWQRITPDVTIEINDPKRIRTELDSIGVNTKYVFGDYDSIAKYIMEKK